MNYGLTDTEFEFLLATVVRPLKQNLARVYLFGSRARGDQKRFSDVDLCYSLVEPARIAGHIIQEILEKVNESKFPYKIDLVDYAEVATSYRENINHDKIELN